MSGIFLILYVLISFSVTNPEEFLSWSLLYQTLLNLSWALIWTSSCSFSFPMPCLPTPNHRLDFLLRVFFGLFPETKWSLPSTDTILSKLLSFIFMKRHLESSVEQFFVSLVSWLHGSLSHEKLLPRWCCQKSFYGCWTGSRRKITTWGK